MITPKSTYGHWQDTKRQQISVALTPSGNYTTGGDPFSFSQMNNPSIKTGANSPEHVNIECTTGYKLVYVKNVNPTLANGTIKIFNLVNGLELPAVAYPADLAADTQIKMHAIFKKFVDLG